jgi:hypothetical protein
MYEHEPVNKMAVRVGRMYMIGLNKALKCAFYPQYTFKRATCGDADDRANYDDSMTGKKRGKLFDRHVGGLLRCKDWQEPHRDLLANQLVCYLKTNRLTPIASQYPVYDQTCRIGTKVDLICKSDTGKYVLFENKAGYCGYINKNTGICMSSPFEHLEDSPINQFQLYLAFAVSMYKAQNPTHVVDDAQCAILRASPTRLDVFVMRQDLDVVRGFEKLQTMKHMNRQDRRRMIRYVNPCL